MNWMATLFVCHINTRGDAISVYTLYHCPQTDKNQSRFKMKSCRLVTTATSQALVSSQASDGDWKGGHLCRRLALSQSLNLLQYYPGQSMEEQFCRWVCISNKQDRTNSTERERKEATRNRVILLCWPAYCFNRGDTGSRLQRVTVPIPNATSWMLGQMTGHSKRTTSHMTTIRKIVLHLFTLKE